MMLFVKRNIAFVDEIISQKSMALTQTLDQVSGIALP